MNTQAILAALPFLVMTIGTQARADDCAVPTAPLRVDFPVRAQELRQHGTVEVAILLDGDGRVIVSNVYRSSGHATLDRAATVSARNHWRFDVAKCSPSDLLSTRAVSVTYERPPGLTVSGTLNRQASAALREAAADRDCHAAHPSHDTVVTSCRSTNAAAIQAASR